MTIVERFFAGGGPAKPTNHGDNQDAPEPKPSVVAPKDGEEREEATPTPRKPALKTTPKARAKEKTTTSATEVPRKRPAAAIVWAGETGGVASGSTRPEEHEPEQAEQPKKRPAAATRDGETSAAKSKGTTPLSEEDCRALWW